ncbi:MAG: hypothetical protein EOP85_23620, partial [Verrucomicrobiaceae bacterium]
MNETDSAILEVALSLEEGPARDAFITRVFQGDLEGQREMTQLIDDARSAAAYFIDARDRRSEVAFDL